MISSPSNNNISSAIEQTDSSAAILTPVKRPIQASLNDVTPSPPRKRLAPTSSRESEPSSDSQRFALQRCHAWSEDSQEEAAVAIEQKSRKRARVSFNVPLLRRTMFYDASFSLVTPIHWNDLVSATDNLQSYLARATEKEQT
jgi:hypothetical protein